MKVCLKLVEQQEIKKLELELLLIGQGGVVFELGLYCFKIGF